jgi:enterochelin esterase family protein
VTRGALAIADLLAAADGGEGGGAPAAAIEAFLARHPPPIVEGSSITFLYRGRADDVRLRHWVFGLPSSQPFRRLRGSDLWWLVLDVPPESRIEYKLEVEADGVRRLVLDPANPRVAHDPFGTNSVCHGSGYQRPEWTLPDAEARPGSLEEMEVFSEAFGETRRVAVYLPARFRPTRRYRLLVAHDGDDYLRYAGMKTVLDNLIHRYEVPPLVSVFTQSPDRTAEYAADPRHARFLADDLLPALEARLPLRERARDRALLGASLGAVASFAAACERPGTFGRLLLQSGTFAFRDIGAHRRETFLEPVVALVNAFRRDPRPVSERVFVSCGVYESLVYENRSFLPSLQASGMDVRYVEARDGHNWENWRDRLREGLSWLFPGPVGLVYE